MVVQAQEEMSKGPAMSTDPHHTPIITQPSSSQPQRKQKSRRPKRKDTKIPQSSGPTDTIVDEAVNEEMDDNLERTQSKATHNEPSSLGTSSDGGPRRQETMRDTIAQTRVLDLENTKTAQAQEITSLKLRIKSLGDQEDASKQGREINEIDKDAKITLVDETQGRYGDEDMFGVHDLDGDEVVIESEVTDKAGEKRNIVEKAVAMTDAVTILVSAAIITNVELTLAQTLAELKSSRPKTKGVVMQELSESTPTISLQLPSQVKSQGSKDKGKAKMIEPEKPLKKKNQIKFDDEEALRLQAEFDEEDRLAREKAQQVEETNIAWDDIQLAKRLQAQEQHESKEKRNRPHTRAQQRSIMCTYLKNMKGWKPKDLKNKSFANIQELFDKAMKRVNTFVDMDTELVEEEVAIDAIPLATKPPSIVDYKIIKEVKISYFQIIRADGSSKRYSAFIHMLRSFDRKDLETL
ncbi:hypothetical protein Tco_0253035 [Tanacetum coccineum]